MLKHILIIVQVVLIHFLDYKFQPLNLKRKQQIKQNKNQTQISKQVSNKKLKPAGNFWSQSVKQLAADLAE